MSKTLQFQLQSQPLQSRYSGKGGANSRAMAAHCLVLGGAHSRAADFELFQDRSLE